MSVVAIDIKRINGLQDIKIPQSLAIDDDKVYLKKIGNSIVIIPFHNPWQNFIDSTYEFTDDFFENRNQLQNQPR